MVIGGRHIRMARQLNDLTPDNHPYLGLLMAPNPLLEPPLPRPRKPRPLGGRLVMHSPGLFVLFGIT